MITRHRRGHAQAGVGIEIIRADETLGEFVGDVILLGGELSRTIKSHGIGPMLVNNRAEPLRQIAHALVPGHAFERAIGTCANLRVEQPIGGVLRSQADKSP